MKDEFSLPEFAFLDAHYSDTDYLAQRDVAIHIPTGTILEFVPAEDFLHYDSDLIQREFDYHNVYGVEESFVVFVHHCFTDEGRGSANRIRFDILHKAIRWFCEYMDWEDKGIITEDTANMN